LKLPLESLPKRVDRRQRNWATPRLFPAYDRQMKAKSAVDEFDRALLDLVQRNNLTPARDLARRVGLSESAVLRRLRRLRRDKVIAADVAIVDPAAIGLPLTIIVLVSLERESAAALDAFARRLKARPEVRQGWYVTGEADWVITLRVASMAAYEQFTREMFLNDANVKAFRTFVAMREMESVSSQSEKKAPR
jgi:Lrp/AsnC family transcriptional regulator, leucine-responsive regulatory protein